ncbi:NAD(P)H-dependent oxidoreductase [Endozoicomonas sp. 8E]|uniref:NADPH-dependent FMN reductase n=1 Tax=Endozoicomonas sp. 8E TaxID=3035692 RepID=UPI002938D600|nr:NAD(P)H-dependent oxidoreductase [Endozoicomonas sp. 8E]WOG26190.1 NAD(P)H-dependent oxidoreductase [Endozoicomonas sp. 8E]
MNLTIISGSHRKESQSARIGHVLKLRAQALALFDQVDVLDLAENPLPLWDESIFSGNKEWKSLLAPWKARLNASDAIIVVSPEWNGMVPSGLKNFFLIFGAQQLGHKPGLITAVSAEQGGSYPVMELRSSSYKNCRLCYIPDHLIVRNVASVMTGEDAEADRHVQERMDYSLAVLKEYALALKGVRESGVIDYKTFRNGM